MCFSEFAESLNVLQSGFFIGIKIVKLHDCASSAVVADLPFIVIVAAAGFTVRAVINFSVCSSHADVITLIKHRNVDGSREKESLCMFESHIVTAALGQSPVLVVVAEEVAHYSTREAAFFTFLCIFFGEIGLITGFVIGIHNSVFKTGVTAVVENIILNCIVILFVDLPLDHVCSGVVTWPFAAQGFSDCVENFSFIGLVMVFDCCFNLLFDRPAELYYKNIVDVFQSIGTETVKVEILNKPECVIYNGFSCITALFVIEVRHIRGKPAVSDFIIAPVRTAENVTAVEPVVCFVLLI